MKTFRARIEILGINPFVHVPAPVLKVLFASAGRDRGPIPVRGTLDGAPFQQTLVRYAGAWRLYTNLVMLKAAGGLAVGDTARVALEVDPRPRTWPVPPAFARALAEDAAARKAYEALPPSRRKEICRYLGALKSEDARARNVGVVIAHLTGEGRPRTQHALMRRPRPAAKRRAGAGGTR